MNLVILLPAATALLAVVFALALLDQWRERRQTFQLVWAIGMIFFAIGSSCEAIAGATRLERAPVPGLVPDRGDLDGRLARPRDGVPARPDAVRLHVRRLSPPGRRVHAADPAQVRLRRARVGAAAVPRRRRSSWRSRSESRRTSRTAQWPRIAAAGVVGATILSLVLMVMTTLPAPGYSLDPVTVASRPARSCRARSASSRRS